MDEVIQTLWIGKRLSTMEQLCIRSYLAAGYPVHLYCYDQLEGVPEGTTICDGRQILPEADIFFYSRGFGKGSPSGFSNFFRYKLLMDRGGWWSDLDAVCLKRFDFEADHVVGNQREPKGGVTIAAGLIKAPPGSPLMKYCWDACNGADKRKLRWGDTGPELLNRAKNSLDVPIAVLDPQAFYPVDFWDVDQLVQSGDLPTDSYSIHLWNAMWRRKYLDPDGAYPATSIYEQLKRRFGLPTHASLGHDRGNFLRRSPKLKRLVRSIKSTYSTHVKKRTD